jgi:FdhD protein
VFGDLMDEIDAVRLPPEAAHAGGAARAARPRPAARDDHKQAGRAGCNAAPDATSAEIMMFVETWAATTPSTPSPGRCGSTRSTAATGLLHDRPTHLEMVIRRHRWGFRSSSPARSTQMGHEIALNVGMTMIGRATGRHFLLFTG